MGGIQINGTSGNNLVWETDQGGDIGKNDGTSKPDNVYVATRVKVGDATTSVSIFKSWAMPPSTTGPALHFTGGGANNWSFGVSSNVMRMERGGDLIATFEQGATNFFATGSPTWTFGHTDFTLQNSLSDFSITGANHTAADATAAHKITVKGSAKTAGTGNGGALELNGGASVGGTGGEVTVSGGSGSAGNASGGDAVIQGGAKSGSGAHGAVKIKTAGTERLAVNAAGKVTIGSSGGSETHEINGAAVSPGSVGLSFSNGPTGTSGNPSIYLKLNINGTDYVFPGFAI